MEFRANNPGAVQYGNFINYYQFNPPQERIHLLPEEFWREYSSSDEGTYLVLDVGCHCGDFTQLLHEFLSKHLNRNVIVLGIDIDPILIVRAEESNKFPENVFYKTMDITKTTDVVKTFLNSHNKTKFDAVLCMSVTMWIHLNKGDEGLRDFLETTSDLAKLLVVEPQPWKCYKSAEKRLKKANELFPALGDLQWRENVEIDIHNYLENNLLRRKIYESSLTKWKRKICFYRS